MADNNPVRSKRDQHLERLRKKYPDRKFEDDEEIFGAISDDYDQFEQENTTMRDREKAFSEMFTSDPRSARMMMEWKNGNDPAISLLRIYGDDILEACNDPDKQEAIKEANKEFATKVAKEKEYEELYDKNIEESLAGLEQMATEEGLSDEDIDKAMEYLVSICRDMMLGKFTRETVRMMLNAINHDTDVANAQEEGEVAGRNSKIVEQMRKSKKGDGIQNLNGRNGTPRQNPDKTKSVFDLAREAD